MSLNPSSFSSKEAHNLFVLFFLPNQTSNPSYMTARHVTCQAAALGVLCDIRRVLSCPVLSRPMTWAALSWLTWPDMPGLTSWLSSDHPAPLYSVAVACTSPTLPVWRPGTDGSYLAIGPTIGPTIGRASGHLDIPVSWHYHGHYTLPYHVILYHTIQYCTVR